MKVVLRKTTEKEDRTFNWWGHKIDWQGSSFPGHFSQVLFEHLANWIWFQVFQPPWLSVACFWEFLPGGLFAGTGFPENIIFNKETLKYHTTFCLSRMIVPWNWINIHEGSLPPGSNEFINVFSPFQKRPEEIFLDGLLSVKLQRKVFVAKKNSLHDQWIEMQWILTIEHFEIVGWKKKTSFFLSLPE